MTAERWQQVEKLYHSALERQPAERGVFLTEACQGDEARSNSANLASAVPSVL